MSKDEPKIEFPCPNYPIKIVGEAGVEFREYVLTIVEKHAPGFDAELMEVRDSKKGNYQSITLFITATGEPQLSALNKELRLHQMVRLVL
jgi:putative lipoic acid-binding regulatory protein